MSDRWTMFALGTAMGALAFNFYIQQSTLGRVNQVTGGWLFG